MKNLIFIEGVSGVGKSTTAAKLCGALHDRGYTASCHLEGDPDNPLELCWFAYLTKPEFEWLKEAYPAFVVRMVKNSIADDDYTLVQYRTKITRYYSPEIYEYLKEREVCYKPSVPVPFTKFTEVFQNRWRRFCENDFTKRDYTIFDGALLHHQINDLIRNYAASDDEITEHLTVLFQTIVPLNPIIIYLSAENVGDCLIKANKSRGQAIATDKQIKFWENRKRIDLAVIEKLAIESHIIDISKGNWETAIDAILAVATKGFKKL